MTPLNGPPMIEIEIKGFDSNLDHQDHKGHVLQAEHPVPEVAEDAGLDRDQVNAIVHPDRTLCGLL